MLALVFVKEMETASMAVFLAKVQTLAKAISDSESFEKKLGPPVSSMPGKLEDLDHVVLSRLVRGHKGKWQILPADVIENQANACAD
jgi:hypothetical protein